MQRREFIILFGGGAAAWPLVVRAQQPTMPVIGWVAGGSHNNTYERYLASFRQGLSEVGFAEGRDFTIEYYWAQGEYDRLSWLVAGLVEREVAVIVALGDVAARAAKLATSATPIVFGSGSDPVKIGLVSNLSRPDTNLTGVSVVDAELESKKLELLKEVVPRATTIAFLVNPDGAMTEIRVRDMRAAARARGLGLHVLNARTKYDLNAAFAKFGELAAGAMAIASESVFTDEGEILGQLAIRYNVPAISAHREFTAAGGLMSYGTNLSDANHQIGIYVGRILKGQKPADLPVQKVTTVELVLNLASAKALGLTVPQPILGRANAVIE